MMNSCEIIHAIATTVTVFHMSVIIITSIIILGYTYTETYSGMLTLIHVCVMNMLCVSVFTFGRNRMHMCSSQWLMAYKITRLSSPVIIYILKYFTKLALSHGSIITSIY